MQLRQKGLYNKNGAAKPGPRYILSSLRFSIKLGTLQELHSSRICIVCKKKEQIQNKQGQ
jgi:hypothetical protein